jgi:DNA-directed RNA polymerase subunit M/transcription elongation factor TFIIS
MHEPAHDWRHRLTPERPVYECPRCKEAAMQFFVERADKPGREDFYYCCACGSTWEV